MQWSFLLICVGSIWVKNGIASSYMLMVGVAASRLGLWMFDLAVIQQMQVGYNIFSRKTFLSRILPYVTLTRELISNTGLCSSVELALFVNNHYILLSPGSGTRLGPLYRGWGSEFHPINYGVTGLCHGCNCPKS